MCRACLHYNLIKNVWFSKNCVFLVSFLNSLKSNVFYVYCILYRYLWQSSKITFMYRFYLIVVLLMFLNNKPQCEWKIDNFNFYQTNIFYYVSNIIAYVSNTIWMDNQQLFFTRYELRRFLANAFTLLWSSRKA